MAVIHYGVRRVSDPVPGKPEAPTEVDVFVEEEVIVVEPADLPVGVPPDDHRPAAGEQDVALRRIDRPRFAVAGLNAEPGQGRATAHEVDGLPVPAHDPAAGAGNIRRGGHRPHQRLEPLRVRPGVVVEEGDQLGVELLHRQVVASGETEVHGRGDHPDVGVRRLSKRGGAVRRSVVDHHHPVLTLVALRP